MQRLAGVEAGIDRVPGLRRFGKAGQDQLQFVAISGNVANSIHAGKAGFRRGGIDRNMMLRDVNDSDADARALVKLLEGIPAKVNLIPFNPWPGAPFECSTPERIRRFSDIVVAGGYASPVRTPRGQDISAACGQLKSASVRTRRSERPAA